MMRLLALWFVPFLLGHQIAEPPLREVHGAAAACGFVVPPPQGLSQWKKSADFVIHVRIDSQFAFEHVRSELRQVVTAHDAAVLELIKAHPRGVAAGAVQQVLQMGGRVQRGDHFYTQTWNGFPTMPVGSEWVLFLAWDTDLEGFTLFYGERGAVQVLGGKIVTPGGILPPDWNGVPAEEFLQVLRALR